MQTRMDEHSRQRIHALFIETASDEPSTPTFLLNVGAGVVTHIQIWNSAQGNPVRGTVWFSSGKTYDLAGEMVNRFLVSLRDSGAWPEIEERTMTA
ncbi:MAG TPA: hypothetical protein VFO27_19845 [Bryobacteraceae bacterium]|nr:hypothetical protein [Bryobacteraceae bacterium]